MRSFKKIVPSWNCSRQETRIIFGKWLVNFCFRVFIYLYIYFFFLSAVASSSIVLERRQTSQQTTSPKVSSSPTQSRYACLVLGWTVPLCSQHFLCQQFKMKTLFPNLVDYFWTHITYIFMRTQWIIWEHHRVFVAWPAVELTQIKWAKNNQY